MTVSSWMVMLSLASTAWCSPSPHRRPGIVRPVNSSTMITSSCVPPIQLCNRIGLDSEDKPPLQHIVSRELIHDDHFGTPHIQPCNRWRFRSDYSSFVTSCIRSHVSRSGCPADAIASIFYMQHQWHGTPHARNPACMHTDAAPHCVSLNYNVN